MRKIKTREEIRLAADQGAWFMVLERARRTGDYTLADRAQRELQRLGVIVTFTVPQQEKTAR